MNHKTEKERRFVCGALLWVVLGLLLLLGCSGQSSEPRVARTNIQKIVPISGEPIQERVGELSAGYREFLRAFSESVPDPLPPMAYASVILFDPAKEPSTVPLADLNEGIAQAPFALANPGSLTNQPNVLCLRNQVQVSCSKQADVWQLILPPKSLAILSNQLEAESGDRLTFLFLADQDHKRIQYGSTAQWIFVEKRTDLAKQFVEAPAREKIFGGCDFAILITDPSNTSTSPLDLFRHGPTPHQIKLYLLIQLCQPTDQDYVQLVPVVDRTQVIDFPGEIWHSPIRLTGAATLIPIDTTQLLNAKEFQLAVISLSDSMVEALDHGTFTQAISFEPR